MSLDPSQFEVVDSDLVAGKVISAIRNYRQFTGSNLETAKRFIDQRVRELHAAGKLPTPEPASISQLDTAVLNALVPFKPKRLKAISKVFRQMDSLLYGHNYGATFSVSATTLPGNSFPIREVMHRLYPDTRPGEATTSQVNVSEFEKEITECVSYEGDSFAGPEFTPASRSRLHDELIPALLREIEFVTPLHDSAIYSYSSDKGLPGYYVFWFFAFLIHHPPSATCLVLTGMTSD